MTSFHEQDGQRVFHGDALAVMRGFPDASFDSVVSDPPYACVDRPYGRLEVPEWEALMHAVVRETRRVLKPRGSAVFIIQPNSERIGKLRPWAFDFVGWCAREWGLIQDAYWINPTTPPLGGAPTGGLMRPSVKLCVWIGCSDCYRNQDAVLKEECESNGRHAARAKEVREVHSCGMDFHLGKSRTAAGERGGSTPFNLLSFTNGASVNGATGGAYGHGAATPLDLCRWWVRYITPRGGHVLDPFNGTGTVLLAARAEGCKGTGIEKDLHSCEAARERLKNGLTPPAKARGQAQLAWEDAEPVVPPGAAAPREALTEREMRWQASVKQ